VFGLGYVGSVTAACLADAGHTVVGVDVDEDKVRMVSAGMSPVVEPGLDELLTGGVRMGRLSTTTSVHEAVLATDVALICGGTPGRADGRPAVGALERVARGIGLALRSAPKPYTVVLRSTVLPGTIDDVLIPTLATAAGTDGATSGAAAGAVAGTGRAVIRVVSNPEFMREGSALRDFAEPAFTLVGTDDPIAAETLKALYAKVTAPFVVTSVRTAEMVKYVSNAFHAVKIAFANEIGDLAESLGVDPQEVMRVFALDKKLNVSGA